MQPAVVATLAALPAVVPETTQTDDPFTLAFGESVLLVRLIAQHDWAAVRVISPEFPEWSDTKYESGYRGLLGATLYVGDSAFVSGAVELWMAEVASEQRGSAVQTTLYCVHWEYSLQAETIDRLHGKTIRTIGGDVDPSTLRDEGVAKCTRRLVP